MSCRSIWKGPFVDPQLLKKVNNMIFNNKFFQFKTWSRNSVILPHFVGLKLSVHNGKNFIPLFITERMVGKKIGEFILTRKFTGHQSCKANNEKDKK